MARFLILLAVAAVCSPVVQGMLPSTEAPVSGGADYSANAAGAAPQDYTAIISSLQSQVQQLVSQLSTQRLANQQTEALLTAQVPTAQTAQTQPVYSVPAPTAQQQQQPQQQDMAMWQAQWALYNQQLQEQQKQQQQQQQQLAYQRQMQAYQQSPTQNPLMQMMLNMQKQQQSNNALGATRVAPGMVQIPGYPAISLAGQQSAQSQAANMARRPNNFMNMMLFSGFDLL